MTPPPNAALLLHLSRCLEARAEGYILEYRSMDHPEWTALGDDVSIVIYLCSGPENVREYEMRIKPAPFPDNLTGIHSSEQCTGHYCCIHNPSDHRMRHWPMHWRDDKGVMERICKHGVGHPDPDDAAYNERRGQEVLNVHGCCGCCNGKEARQ